MRAGRGWKHCDCTVSLLLKLLTLFSTSSFQDQWGPSDSNTNATQIIKLLGNEDKSLIKLFMSLINLQRGTSSLLGIEAWGDHL